MIIFSEIFTLAFQSLLRNKLRSILTMLGIIIGVASVILLVSIGTGIQGYITKQFESLGSNLIYVVPGKIGGGNGGPPMTNLTLSQRDVKAINRLGFPVKEASGLISNSVSVKHNGIEKTYSVAGIESTAVKQLNLEIDKGELITQGDLDKNSRVVVLGPKAAETLFIKESPVGKSVLIQSSKYKVIGVVKTKGGGGGFGPNLDEMLYIPLTTAQKQFNQDKLQEIYITASNKDVIPQAKQKVETLLLKSHSKDDFTVMGQEDLLTTINSILGIITAGLGGIAAISLFVGGIGIMNIMFVTVTERTKEIGLRKALGARPKDILIQFLIEAITVSIVGGSIGISIAMGISVVLNRFLSSQVTLGAIILAFGFSTLIGVIFGVVPAWKAARLDPIKALRYE